MNKKLKIKQSKIEAFREQKIIVIEVAKRKLQIISH